MTPSADLPYPSRPAGRSSWPRAWRRRLLGVAGDGVIDARSLPPQYALAHVENTRTLDLSRLATFAVSNQRIDRGDVLDVTLGTGYADSVNNTVPVRVGDHGTANIPLVGKVYLAGFELEGAEQAVAAAGVSRGMFLDPHVTVTMHTQRINRVTVIGAVEKPGVYELPRGSSLLSALVAAGGMSKDAGTEVELRPSGPRGESDRRSQPRRHWMDSAGSAARAIGRLPGPADAAERFAAIRCAARRATGDHGKGESRRRRRRREQRLFARRRRRGDGLEGDRSRCK